MCEVMWCSIFHLFMYGKIETRRNEMWSGQDGFLTHSTRDAYLLELVIHQYNIGRRAYNEF